MWILIFLFFLSTFILGWTLFGYYIWLFLFGILKKETNPISDILNNFPLVSLIVPTYNEENFVLKKIENMRSFDYPPDKLQIIFVDGGSCDRTLEIIKKNKTSYMELLVSSSKGKTNQLNFALKYCKGEIVFITDVDSFTSPNVIKEALKEFERDKNIYVVGVYSDPRSSYKIERYYWLTQNKGRLLETQAFTSSIVIAVCYSFRKGLINEFPCDVVADDIYISYLANSSGYRVSYIDRCYAEELRGPEHIKDFLSHKFRKSNAFLRESLRFFYQVSEMNPIWKTIFLTKISQMIFIPCFFFFYIILGGALISLRRWDVFFLSIFFIFLLFLLTSKIFSLIRKEEKEKFSLEVMTKTFLLSIFILFITGISFLFFRQDSNYKKINVS